MYNIDKLALFLAEDCIADLDIVRIDKSDTGVVLSTADIKIEPVWDEPTEVTVLKVVYKNVERWFNTVDEIIYWLRDKMDGTVKSLPLLAIL